MENNISKTKKNLLIFFGECRTFEYVVPHLKKLDKVDIVISTWSESKRYDTNFLVNENLIKKIVPNIKQIHIVNPNQILDIENKTNTWKMFYHWKNAINNVINVDKYDNVILHRTDLVSNWHEILNKTIEDNTIYFQHNDIPYENGNEKSAFWINDYYFFGKFNIIKKFINLLDKDNYYAAHIPLYWVIFENNIKYKNHIFNGFLIRDENIEFINEFTIKNEICDNYSQITGPSERKGYFAYPNP